MESHRSPRRVALGLKGHGLILSSVENREPAVAAEATAKHLRDSRKIFPPDVMLRQFKPGDRGNELVTEV